MRNMVGNMRTINAISHFHYQLYKKVQNGYSPIIMICGEQRIGKSAYALSIANLFSQFMYEEDFDYKKYSFYDTERAIEEMGNMIKRVILIDEGGESMDYLEWYDKMAKAMRSMINTQAFRGNVYIIISPFVVEILKNIRRHVNFKAHVVSRGHIKVWKYVKRHQAEKQDKATYPIFLDNIDFKLSSLPKGLYNGYKEFSELEKEKIRLKRLKESQGKKKILKISDVERKKNMMPEVLNG